MAAANAPIAFTLAAWQERWALAQALWATGLAVVALFVVRRAPAAGAKSVPGVFVWVPLALLSGVTGAALVALAAVLDPSGEPAFRQLGRGGGRVPPGDPGLGLAGGASHPRRVQARGVRLRRRVLDGWTWMMRPSRIEGPEAKPAHCARCNPRLGPSGLRHGRHAGSQGT